MSLDSTGVASALDRAAMLGDLGRWDEAAPVLGSVIASDPHNRRALCLLSLARINQSAYDEAFAAAQAAISAAPDDEWPYRLASISLSRLGRHAEAVAMARRAVELAPHQSEGFRALALALRSRGGNLDEARAMAAQGLALAPHAADSFLTVGSVEAAAGRTTEAEEAFRQALRIDPNNSVAHNELTRLHLGKRRFGTPTGLAADAHGFAAAVRSDPRSQVSRRNVDLVIHVFLARTAYLIFLAAWIGSRVAGADAPRLADIVPALLLLIPVYYAARFLTGLTPALRGIVTDYLRRPSVAIAVGCDALAVIGLVLGAVVTTLDTAAFAVAAGLALIARISLWRTSRKNFPATRQRLIGKGVWIFLGVAVAIVVLALVFAYFSG